MIFLQNNNGHVENLSSYESLKESAKFAHCSANCHVPKISLNIGGLGGPQDLVSMSGAYKIKCTIQNIFLERKLKILITSLNIGPSFGSRFNLSWPRARYSKNPLSPPESNATSEKSANTDSAQYAASR